MKIFEMTAAEQRELLVRGEVNPEEILEAYISRIESVEQKINSFVTLTLELAKEEAKALKREIIRDPDNRVAGIPMAVKDLFSTKGIRTTCSSKMLEDFIPVYDATVVEKLKSQGMIMIGKTNMDEFAMGSSTENSAFKTTLNPWDPERVPGGSSGGSAAAVAAGECAWALGSDTGGSIRQPAAFCGVVGMKPTYGLVSRYGIVAFASSLDQAGPISRDVRDCAALLQAIAGSDSKDSTSIPGLKVDLMKDLEEGISEMRFGIIDEISREGIDEGVRDQMERAAEAIKDLGGSLKTVSMPSLKYALSAYYIIAPAEASSNLAKYDGIRYGYRADNTSDIIEMYGNTRSEGFGAEVKRRIMLGTYALSSGYYDAYYSKAQKIRTLIIEDFKSAFADCDLLISPATPFAAFKVGEKVSDLLSMYMSDMCTIPVNLAGIPAISIPCGFSGSMPTGLQIIGDTLQEANVLKAARALEKAFDFKLRPQL